MRSTEGSEGLGDEAACRGGEPFNDARVASTTMRHYWGAQNGKSPFLFAHGGMESHSL